MASYIQINICIFIYVLFPQWEFKYINTNSNIYNYCLKNCINVENVHHTGLINFELKATTQSADYTQMLIQ